jgi:hypothetical protein
MKLASFGSRTQIVGMVIIVIGTLAAIYFLSYTPATSSVANRLRNFMGLASVATA